MLYKWAYFVWCVHDISSEVIFQSKHHLLDLYKATSKV